MPPELFSGSEWLTLAIALLLIVAIKPLRSMVLLAIIGGLLIGLWRGGITQIGLRHYQPYYGQTITLSGKVTEDTTYGARGDQRLRLGAVHIEKQALPGVVWVSTGNLTDVKRGDMVTVHGKLSEGFGNLPASLYRAELIAAKRPNPGDVARRVRDWFAGGVRRTIPEPEASLGVGYLVGQRSSLPESLDDQLRAIGLTHIVVASGYNLTILVRFARRSFGRLSKYLAALSASLMIGGFMLITGLSPSMTRAGLVSGLSLVAWYYGRRIHPLVLLPFAAAVTTLINPAYLWGDIGWYLSFVSFAGVIILGPLLQRYFWGANARLDALKQILIETASAQLLTLPLIVFAFGQYSGYALLANLLVLPAVPFIMLLTFLGGLGGLILPWGGSWFGAPAGALLTYTTSVVEWVAGLPGARGELTITASQLIAGYAALLLFIVFLWRRTRYRFDEYNIVE